MNLLIDPWIPIQSNQEFKLITLESLLCETEPIDNIVLNRDDMELACLQLLICLTQVLFLPKDMQDLKIHIAKPLTKKAYKTGIKDYLEWFDLTHPTMPFMQTRGVKAKKTTSIQKLFIGLPAGNNHAFFNHPEEIKVASLSAVAIALFNQAMNSPSFGGGFKGGFRGGAPITTLISGTLIGQTKKTGSLRQIIWFNVLHQESVNELLLIDDYNEIKAEDKPTWVVPIKEKSKISSTKIGLLRGLFWQPAHIELTIESQAAFCDFHGLKNQKVVSGFKTEKFVYEIIGPWKHPHSPSTFELKTKITRYRSFTTTAPAWTQFHYFIAPPEDNKNTYSVAKVVEQFNELFGNNFKFHLMIGGYRNKQALILQRKHELLPLAIGWDKNGKQVEDFINQALLIKNQLRQKLYGFSKTIQINGLSEKAEYQFYQQSESIILAHLTDIDWTKSNQSSEVIKQLTTELITLSWQIFTDITRPYQHEGKMIQALVRTRRTLAHQFNKIKGEFA